MITYKEFHQLLRTVGSYTSLPLEQRKRSLFGSMFSSVRYALTIIRIVVRCAWLNLFRRFNENTWAETCLSCIKFAERLGTTVTLEGFEQRAAYNGPVVYVSNHMSTLETMAYPVILTAFGKLAIILKKSLDNIPLVGASARAVGSIAVTRKNARADLKIVMEQGAERLANGSSVLIFPQGTRQLLFDPEQFNTLGAKLATRAGVPLVPLAVRTDIMRTGRVFKDFGSVDPSLPLMFACGPVLMPELGAKVIHTRSLEFITQCVRKWDMPIKENGESS